MKKRVIHTCGECGDCSVLWKYAYCYNEKVKTIKNYLLFKYKKGKRISIMEDIFTDGEKQYIPDWCPLEDD